MQVSNINSKLNFLHDAILVSMKDDIKTKSSKLTFLSEDEKLSLNVVLHGIVSSRCTNWKIGNIVLDASVTGINMLVDPNIIIELIIFTEELSKIQIQNQAYLPIMKDIESGKLFIFELNPSYGAYYVGIAQDITIETNRILHRKTSM